MNHDNINGIEITDCNDIPYLTNCHAWPFATMVQNQVWQHLIRSGNAYHLHDFVDWARLTNCFSYGYSVGFLVSNANSVVLTACGADNAYSGSAPLNTGSIGYVIQSTCYETKLIGCQAAAQDAAGIFINVTDDVTTLISDATIWKCKDHGILISNGDAKITGGVIRDIDQGITVDDSLSEVHIDATLFTGITAQPINVTVPNSTVKYNGYTDFAGNPVSSNYQPASVASAASVLLPANGDLFTITGTTNFGGLAHGWAGRRVTLIFADNLTVFSGTGAVTNMKLLSGGNLTTSAGAVLSLVHNGIQWYETGRS